MWTKDLPTGPGWYWWRSAPHGDGAVVRIERMRTSGDLSFKLGGYIRPLALIADISEWQPVEGPK